MTSSPSQPGGVDGASFCKRLTSQTENVTRVNVAINEQRRTRHTPILLFRDPSTLSGRRRIRIRNRSERLGARRYPQTSPRAQSPYTPACCETSPCWLQPTTCRSLPQASGPIHCPRRSSRRGRIFVVSLCRKSFLLFVILAWMACVRRFLPDRWAQASAFSCVANIREFSTLAPVESVMPSFLPRASVRIRPQTPARVLGERTRLDSSIDFPMLPRPDFAAVKSDDRPVTVIVGFLKGTWLRFPRHRSLAFFAPRRRSL